MSQLYSSQARRKQHDRVQDRADPGHGWTCHQGGFIRTALGQVPPGWAQGQRAQASHPAAGWPQVRVRNFMHVRAKTSPVFSSEEFLLWSPADSASSQPPPDLAHGVGFSSGVPKTQEAILFLPIGCSVGSSKSNENWIHHLEAAQPRSSSCYWGSPLKQMVVWPGGVGAEGERARPQGHRAAPHSTTSDTAIA